MEDQQHNYNLANISHISELSYCTVREQPSQLELDTKTCLHSTFSYPLHSTVNYMDHGSLDLSELTSTSKTLTDCDNTVVKLNENLRESDYYSTNSATKNTLDSYNTLKGNEHSKDCGTKNITVLWKSQSKEDSAKSSIDKTVPANCRTSDSASSGFSKLSNYKPMVDAASSDRTCDTAVSMVNPTGNSRPLFDKTVSCGWESDDVSDCDSSCLSFDVDELSFCGDEFSNSNNNTLCVPKLVSFQDPASNCYINHVIHKEVAAQMWGKDQSKSLCSATTEGTCDVCRLLRMKRQKASTDLWSRQNSHFDDPDSLMSRATKDKVTFNVDEKVERYAFESNKYKSKLSSDSKPKTPRLKRKRRSSFENLQKRKSLRSSEVTFEHERPRPEGMEVLSENISTSFSTVSLSNTRKRFSESLSRSASISDSLLSQSNDSGFTSCNSSQRNDVYGCGCTVPLSALSSLWDSQNAICDRCIDNKENIPHMTRQSHMTPGSARLNRLSKASRRHSPFSEAVPSPSPWKGDKKLIKRRMKEMKSANGQYNIETLACF